MLFNKVISVISLITLSACTTAPTSPIDSNPVVTAKTADSYEITVRGLPGKRAIDVERGFHEVADKTCINMAGWGGWKMLEGTSITPTMNAAGRYVAKGQVVCSR